MEGGEREFTGNDKRIREEDGGVGKRGDWGRERGGKKEKKRRGRVKRR